MNNRWNRIIYKAWAPVYDRFFNRGPFLKARKDVFGEMNFEPGEKVLFAGCGTGVDIEQVPFEKLKVTAFDFSPDMLAEGSRKFPDAGIEFLEMDAQSVQFESGIFDTVIASLILSVVPDPGKAFAEMIRVTTDGGRIVIFDKFASEGSHSIGKQVVRPLIKMLGTDIGVNFEALFETNRDKLLIEEDRAVLFNGMYRVIRLKKLV